MESQRARLGFWRGNFLSVPAWYRLLTKYGTSVGRGLFVFACLLVLHAFATHWLQGVVAGGILELPLRSIRIATLQKDEVTAIQQAMLQGWVDTTFRICAAIQIALVIFAFRTRIKRY